MSWLDQCTTVRGSNIDSHYIINANDYGMTEYERVEHQHLPLSSTSSLVPRNARYTASAIPLIPRFGLQVPTPPLENVRVSPRRYHETAGSRSSHRLPHTLYPSFYYYSIHFDYPLRFVPSYTLPTNPSTSSSMPIQHAPFAHHSQPLRHNMDIQDMSYEDIQNMSYEASIYDLLDLAERIGKVDTGLPDEIIARQMKTETYQPPNHLEEATSQEQEIDLCVICQDEYKIQESIGILQCGHRYHTDCITTWLHEKNECPICKSKALNIE
ncbi:E3 ubiquitin-protein ligase [Vigna unguiculata]|uniref:RING-type E3 ubiquitin transferase n=1 Tax=Vigna unguiculata TaxID=3917 RepID=A0A4D6LFY7_VIGUN|nr:E3 ubiquitin-protein ligase [Vigna unguiculata]